MDTRSLWSLLLIIGIAAFAAGCTATPALTPSQTETPIPATTRPAASDDLPDFDYAAVQVLSSGATG